MRIALQFAMKLLLAFAIISFVLLPSTSVFADGNFLRVGETLAGWRLERIERHPEYQRFFFSKNQHRTALEVVANVGDPDTFSTKRHKLMPAPGEEPPRALLASPELSMG